MSLSKSAKGNKWKGNYDDSRKFKSEWQKNHPWVRKASDGSENAYCTFCKVNVNPKLSHLKQHEETAKHKKVTSAVSSSRKLFAAPTKDDETVKKIELQLSVAITCHSAIIAVDHLGEIIVQHSTGSKLEKMKLHRTKCSCLIKNVISPALYEDLCHDMAGKKYCVLLDESTDVSCLKHLCVATRYYSDAEKKIVTSFVGLVSVVNATGLDLFNATKVCLNNAGIQLSDCVGYASDGASVMVGEHDSVWSRMRDESPNCILMKCICHSLALCIKHSFEKLPSHLGFLLSEIPKWFSKSIIRREAYKELFDTINGNSESSNLPRPFQKFSQTRWLVRGKVIFNILMNWEELKAYFSIAEQTGDAKVRYKARLIADMLKDPVNKLYFYFLSPVVAEFERVNAFFQATDIDPHDMLKELSLFYDSLRGRVFSPSGAHLAAENVDFGAKYVFEIAAVIRQFDNDPDVVSKVKEANNRCHLMLLEAADQVSKRLPASKDIFQALAFLHPSRVLNQVGRVPLTKLPMQHLITTEMSEIDDQYRKIVYVNWASENIFKDGIPTDSVQYWSGVLQHTDLLGNRPFAELANYALACLTTPTINAVVERIFSYVTCVKTKPRNRMSSRMLEAIVRIRTKLHFQNKCCKDFAPTEGMLKLFNSNNMYKKRSNDKDEDGDDELDFLEI